MILEVKNVFKNFDTKEVLKGIDFRVESGKPLGLLGRNGAGKTTTIRIIMGIFASDSGEILLDGKPINRNEIKMGYLPEERGLYNKKTVLEQMLYFAELKGMTSKMAKSRALELLKKLEAEEYSSKKVETLSKGNQQKIQMAISIINEPDILILDEPFSGLDPVNAMLLKKLVLEYTGKGKIVIFSSHEMSYVEEFCQNIAILKDGKAEIFDTISNIKMSYLDDKIGLVFDVESKENLDILMSDENYKNLVEFHFVEKGINFFKLREEGLKQDFYKFILNSNVGVRNIFVKEPTLEEIFIEVAGDLDE